MRLGLEFLHPIYPPGHLFIIRYMNFGEHPFHALR
jgi:hypothetical protein